MNNVAIRDRLISNDEELLELLFPQNFHMAWHKYIGEIFSTHIGCDELFSELNLQLRADNPHRLRIFDRDSSINQCINIVA